MKERRCPECEKLMEIVDVRKINDRVIKVGFRCEDHPGVTYWMMEKSKEKSGKKVIL